MKRKHTRTRKTSERKRSLKSPILPVSVVWSKTAGKPHTLYIGEHTLCLECSHEEDKSFGQVVRRMPPQVQAFRLLERRRDSAIVALSRQLQEVDRLKRQLRDAWDIVRRHETTLDTMKDFLALLSEDHRTDFRQPLNYDDCKAARKPNEKYYGTSHCWMCGNHIPLEDFHPNRFFCPGKESALDKPSNACAQQAKRRRDKMHKLAASKKPALPPTTWPCPYCERPLSGKASTDASRQHSLDETQRKQFRREQQVIADVYPRLA